MRILAIDPGTNCGYAWTDNGIIHVAQAGTWNLKPQRHEGGGMRYVRLEHYIRQISPGMIYYEEVRRHKGTDAAQIYGGIVAVIQTFCESGTDRKIPYAGIPVGTIKKWATTKGNAGKPAMIEAAADRFGYTGTDDNTADALWLLDYALRNLLA